MFVSSFIQADKNKINALLQVMFYMFFCSVHSQFVIRIGPWKYMYLFLLHF